MLPQTNLQLYRLMIDRGADDGALAAVRTAYDGARQLFGAAFRPSHKPFVAHLVGVAGACVRWGERTDVAVAAMLHSSYLYGDFGDGDRGASPRRREWLCGVVGAGAEALVHEYTLASDWQRSVDEHLAAIERSSLVRDVFAMKLADLLDELGDGGPAYCPQKSLGFTASIGDVAEREVIELARVCLSPQAVADFATAFDALRRFQPPTCLVTGDNSYHVVAPGVPELRRSALGRQVFRLRGRTVRGVAA